MSYEEVALWEQPVVREVFALDVKMRGWVCFYGWQNRVSGFASGCLEDRAEGLGAGFCVVDVESFDENVEDFGAFGVGVPESGEGAAESDVY